MKKFYSKTSVSLSVPIDNKTTANIKFAELKGGGSVFYTDDEKLCAALAWHASKSGTYVYVGEVADVSADLKTLGGILRDAKLIFNVNEDVRLTKYSEIEDKPTIPAKVSDLDNDEGFVKSSQLATVATSGSYNDLTNKPTLATVATTGSYNDLRDQPDFTGITQEEFDEVFGNW